MTTTRAQRLAEALLADRSARNNRPHHQHHGLPFLVPWAPNIQHTVRSTELSPTRFKSFWRE
jgi:hypothetical protein